MTHFVGLDVSQKVTAISAVDAGGARIWRGACVSSPEQVDEAMRINAGANARHWAGDGTNDSVASA